MGSQVFSRVAAGSALLGASLWTAGVAWSERRLPVADPILVTTAYVQRSDALRRNDTVSHLLARHNISGQELRDVLDAAPGLNPRRLRRGQVFEFRYAVDDPRPDRITIRIGDERILELSRDSAANWIGSSEAIAWSVHVERVYGVIRSSLYETVHELIPDSILPREQRSLLIWDLADGVFGWVIDFTRDFYNGDEFRLVYERLTSPMGDVRYGRVLATKIATRAVLNTAYVMTDGRGRNVYFDSAGRSLRRTFKLYPVSSFKYISSGFSRRRYHPVLKTRRAHLGVDYAAAYGTPVTATSDGTVTRAERWGGYGIMVSVRHPKDIETRYAHLSRLAPGIRPGVTVRQGQIIGRAGMTGLANAPHVHYEFLKNGRHVDPRRAARSGDRGEPIAEHLRAEFASLRAYYDQLLIPSSVRTAAPAAAAPAPAPAGID